MAFLHCHKCGWEQDDFWSETYDPVWCVQNWRKYLFSENIDKLFTDDAMFLKKNGNISLREVIAREFERQARKIRSMKFRTPEELKKLNPRRECPQCGGPLCVD